MSLIWEVENIDGPRTASSTTPTTTSGSLSLPIMATAVLPRISTMRWRRPRRRRATSPASWLWKIRFVRNLRARGFHWRR
jgi:hypothetical protein